MIINTKVGNIAADIIDCGNEAPMVVIIHGRGSHRNTKSKIFAEYFQNHGISSVRLDLYGYGESDGKFENITVTTAKESILGVYDYVKANIKYSKLFLFGTSYGGAGVLSVLEVIDPKDLTGCILRSPILNYIEKTKRELTESQIGEWKNSGYLDDFEGRLKYSFFEDMEKYINPDFSKLKEFKFIAFFEGKGDKIIKEEIDEFKSKLGESFSVVIYPNSTHGIDISSDFDDMLVRIKDFIL